MLKNNENCKLLTMANECHYSLICVLFNSLIYNFIAAYSCSVLNSVIFKGFVVE